MKKKINLQGSMVALVTPFKDGKIDRQALKKLIDFQIKNCTDVLVPCGTTGEASTMSHEEHRFVLSFVMDYVGGRVPVICGASSNNTAEALGLVKHARKIKADAVLIVTPYYNKPTQEGLYQHYETLASQGKVPIVLYNVPSRTGVSLKPETVARLSKLDEVVAIKEASGSLDQVDQILSQCDITVLSGEDALTYPMIAIGGKGVISVSANVVPDRMSKMVHAALEGDHATALKTHRELLPIHKAMFMETNPIPVKTALGMMKKIKPEFRLPLCAMSEEGKKRLKQALKKARVIA